MDRIYLLLVSACVAALAALGLASPNRCSTISWGDTYTTTQFRSQPGVLSPGIRDWEVEIPVHPACPQELVRGVKATACDYDVAPVSKFLSKNILYVHRPGSTMMPGLVKTTIYCAPHLGPNAIPVSGGLMAVPNLAVPN